MWEALPCQISINRCGADSNVIISVYMNHFLKTFLLWLLIAVLPLHAVATTMGMSCGPVHQQAMQVAISDDAHHGDGVAAHDHHHDDTDDASSQVASSANDDQSGAPSHQHQHSTCSGCAASCIGAAAPPPAPLLTPAYDSAESYVISLTPLVTGFIPAGLERPPKHISA